MDTGYRMSALMYLGDPARPSDWGWRLHVDQHRGIYHRTFSGGTPLYAAPWDIAMVCRHEPEMLLEISPGDMVDIFGEATSQEAVDAANAWEAGARADILRANEMRKSADGTSYLHPRTIAGAVDVAHVAPERSVGEVDI